MNLVDIQKALIKDEMAEAIKGMFAYDSEHNNDKLSNQIIHQSGRYHANERSNQNGLISSDNYNRTKNQLRHALQQLLNTFPGYGPDIKKQAQAAVMAETGGGGTEESSSGSFKVLMLTSNPKGTDKLQLEQEHSRISTKIQNANNAEQFPIKSRWAITTSEFTEALIDEKPGIVHFSGHGEDNYEATSQPNISRGQGLDSETNKPKDRTGIFLTSEDGRDPVFVSTTIIKRLFRSMIKIHNIPIKAIVFNSCYSEAQAQALSEIIPHVIGTSSSIKDKAAIAFATGFYSVLTRTKNFEAAWDNGVTQAMIYGEPEERFIYFKDGKKISG